MLITDNKVKNRKEAPPRGAILLDKEPEPKVLEESDGNKKRFRKKGKKNKKIKVRGDTNPYSLKHLRQNIRKSRSVVDFIPYRRIISKDCFQLTDGVTDYLQFHDFTIRDGTESDQLLGLYDYSRFLKMVDVDHKLIFTNYPANISDNISYVQKRVENGEGNKNVLQDSAYSLKVLEHIQENRKSNEVYCQIFASDEEELRKAHRLIKNAQGEFIKLRTISLEKKIKLIFKLNNIGKEVFSGTPYMGSDETGRPEKVQAAVENLGYDPVFLGQIQPVGNINTRNSSYIQTGEGYLKILHVFQYKPKSRMFWGESVFKFSDCVTTVDIKNIDKTATNFESSLNRSLQEFEGRVVTARDRISEKKAMNNFTSLNEAVDRILDTDETIKRIHTRIYIHETTLNKLENKEAEVRDKLKRSGVYATTYLDEQEEEFKALFTSYTRQQRVRKRKGQEITGTSLAGSYAFNYAQLIDPNALYSGYPIYGNGIVCLNQFYRDRQRKSYGGWYIGKQGFGKSSAVKLVAKQNRLLNNNSILFVVSKEYKKMVEHYGGIHIDGREPNINWFQIWISDVDEETTETLEQKSYVTNLSRMKNIFMVGSKIESTSVGNIFTKYLKRFYDKWIKTHQLEMGKITQYAAKDYPVAEDFIVYLQKEYENIKEEFVKRDIHTILTAMETMIETYGDIFNVRSNFSLEGKKLVAFNLESLLKADTNIYNAQYLNLFYMSFSHAVKIGQREKFLYDSGIKGIDEIEFTDLVSDEFHNPIRSGNIELIKEMDRTNREGRKIFIGLHFCVHDIIDAFPDLNDNGEMGVISKAVMSLLKLCPYRFIFRQDNSSLPLLKKVFGTEISESDLIQIPKLDEGENLMCISGTTNILFKFDLTEEELRLFDGGA